MHAETVRRRARVRWLLGCLALCLAGALQPLAAQPADADEFAAQIPMPGSQQAWRRIGKATFQHYFQPYYRAALYLSPSVRQTAEVADALTAYQVEIIWQPTELAAGEVRAYWRQALRDAAGDEDTFGRIETRAEHWIAQLPAARHGDRWTFSYLPDAGMTVRINDRPVNRLVGIDFNRSLTRVWFGEAADPEPRAALLGHDTATHQPRHAD